MKKRRFLRSGDYPITIVWILPIRRHRWADRLEALYPSLTNNEKDICFLFVLGLGFDDIADLLPFAPVITTNRISSLSSIHLDLTVHLCGDIALGKPDLAPLHRVLDRLLNMPPGLPSKHRL